MASVKYVLLLVCFFTLGAKVAVHNDRPLHRPHVMAVAP
jgi:hypothetical protein